MKFRGHAVVLGLLLWAWPTRAPAQLALSVDPSVALGTKLKRVGYADEIRFGFRFGLPRSWHVHTVMFQPELAAGDVYLPRAKGPSDDLVVAYRGGGLRLGLALPFNFDLLGYWHAGLGISNWHFESRFDLGAVLDYRPGSWSIGAHGGRVYLPRSDLDWWQVGLHLEHHWFGW